MKSEHRKASVEGIYNYLRWLEQAFIIYPCDPDQAKALPAKTW